MQLGMQTNVDRSSISTKICELHNFVNWMLAQCAKSIGWRTHTDKKADMQSILSSFTQSLNTKLNAHLRILKE